MRDSVGLENVTAVINTCCFGPAGDNLGSSGTAPYKRREYALRNLIIPLYRAWDVDIIVVGEFRPGSGYRYIEWPSVHFGVEDALEQRAEASRAISTEYAIFQHDDHAPDFEFPEMWQRQLKGANIYSPARWARTADGERRINNGEHDPNAGIHNPTPYVSGHFCIMDSAARDSGLWRDAERCFTWDISFTQLAQRRGLSIQWTKDLVVWDVER